MSDVAKAEKMIADGKRALAEIDKAHLEETVALLDELQVFKNKLADLANRARDGVSVKAPLKTLSMMINDTRIIAGKDLSDANAALE